MLTYGINQGMGEKLVLTARQYFIFDDMQLDAATANQLIGFSRIPWQLKSLFGVMSDALPIGGMHRGPYMLLASLLGVIASFWLAITPTCSLTVCSAALLLLFCNVNFSMPDVMVDATVAERAKLAPERTADLQALCWGSFGVFGIPIALAKGNLLELGGAHLLFALSIGTSCCVALPPVLGWLGERPKPSGCEQSRRLCRDLVSTLPRCRVLVAATLVGCFSCGIGLVQLLVAPKYPEEVGLVTVLANFGLCAIVYLTMRPVDEVLARAVIFPFLQGALNPRSDLIFDWSHAPSANSPDQRCWSAAECAAGTAGAGALMVSMLNASATGGGNVADDGSECAPRAAAAALVPPSGNGVFNTPSALPCGWALERHYPCLSPVLLAYVSVAGSVALVIGTVAYASCFQTWRFRSIIGLTQLVLAFASLTDWVWTSRLNLQLGIPDEFLVFGEEVFIDAIAVLNSQPFFIFAAKLCPPGVEASMFALFMGLSNFGNDAGRYLGSSLLKYLGNPSKPGYEGIATYSFVKSLMRALPVLLVPFLVPNGSPADSAAALGAGINVTGGDDMDVDDGPATSPGGPRHQDAGAEQTHSHAKVGDVQYDLNDFKEAS